MYLWMILFSNTLVSLNRRFGCEHRRPHKSKEHLIRTFFNISQIGRNTYICRFCALPLANRLSCDSYQCFLGKPSCRSQIVLCRTFAALLKAPKQFMTLAARFAGFLSKDFHGFLWGISLLTLAGRGDLTWLFWLASSFSHQFHQKADAQNKQINYVYIDIYIYIQSKNKKSSLKQGPSYLALYQMDSNCIQFH